MIGSKGGLIIGGIGIKSLLKRGKATGGKRRPNRAQLTNGGGRSQAGRGNITPIFKVNFYFQVIFKVIRQFTW